jgi:hypothetical protein
MKTPSLQEQLDFLNAELAEVKSQLPKPKPAPIPKKQNFSQLRRKLRIENFTGTRNPNSLMSRDRKDCWSMKMAVDVAAERKKILAERLEQHWEIAFCPWDKLPSDMELQRDTILIIEELEAIPSDGHCFNTIRSWEFENKMPPNKRRPSCARSHRRRGRQPAR